MMRMSLSGFMFVVLVFLSSLVYAQEPLQVKIVDGIYSHADLTEVIQPGQAFLLYSWSPRGTVNSASVFTYQDILSGRANIDFSVYRTSQSYGRYSSQSFDPDSRHVICIIDDQYYYASSNSSFSGILRAVNQLLVDKNLGTIDSRRRYINLLNSMVYIKPFDFTLNLKPWIIAGFVLFLSLPMWYVFKRFLRQ